MSDVNSMPTIPELETEAKNLSQQLTPNQALFCTEYLKDRNGTRAYQRAYPNCKSENAAAVNAVKLLRNAKIDEYIKTELEIIASKHKISVENLKAEESKIINRNIKALVDENSTPIPLADLPDDIAALVDQFEVKPVILKTVDSRGVSTSETQYQYKYKLADRGAALGRMERHLGMYKDKKEISGPGGEPLDVDSMTRNDLARRIAFLFNQAIYEGGEEKS